MPRSATLGVECSPSSPARADGNDYEQAIARRIEYTSVRMCNSKDVVEDPVVVD